MGWMAADSQNYCKHELEFDFCNKLDLGNINLDISRMYLVYKVFQITKYYILVCNCYRILVHMMVSNTFYFKFVNYYFNFLNILLIKKIKKKYFIVKLFYDFYLKILFY